MGKIFGVEIGVFRHPSLKLTSFNKHNQSSELYKNIINDIIEFDIINTKEEFKLNKLELLKKIGDNFKEQFGEKDETVEYIRKLLKNIKNFEPFDIENINKEPILLKSIAHFILKGDDLENLLNTLKENNLATFKISFGLWGALFGFSAIPKTISDILFEEKTKDIIDIQSFLKDMYTKIHNLEVQDDIAISFIKKDIVENTYKQEININHPQIGKEIFNSQISSQDIKNVIHTYIKTKGKEAKINDIITYLKLKNIKIPNTKKQFKIKDIEELVKDDKRFTPIKVVRSKGLKIKF